MKRPILRKQTSLSEKVKSQQEIDEKPLYTGRFLLTLTEGKSFDRTQKIFESKLGFKVANSRDFQSDEITESKISNADALIYEEFGVALIDGEDEHIQLLESTSQDFIIERERVVYVPDYAEEVPVQATWGLNVTNVVNSEFTGKDIKVAVLDTGFDLRHPDFRGRNVVAASFVPDEEVQDGHGHGTHCIGTACGGRDMHNRRYGVASDSIIYVGKVLSNSGSGAQSWTLSAIAWAVNNRCKVISMSFGSPVFPGQGFDVAYERAAQYALSKGCVVVAAAGNESRRSLGQFRPVASPANCPSILAVGALDPDLNVADFSNRSMNPTGQIDVASAGVKVYSSWPDRNTRNRPGRRYRTLSGTSMATPHVAGIVALLWEKSPQATSEQISNELRNTARRLPLQNIDVGVGLSIAP